MKKIFSGITMFWLFSIFITGCDRIKADLASNAAAQGSIVTAQAFSIARTAEIDAIATAQKRVALTAASLPTSTPTYRSIAWIDLADFLASDHTNWNKYDLNNYICLDFAVDLVENSRKQNIQAWIVGVDFTNGETGHAFVAFETSDRGIIYVEPQGDNTYSNVTVGNPLCDDWGKYECMGVIKSLKYYLQCDHKHYCTEYTP